MAQGNTLARSLHDLGMAAWFGGSLMGAVGLNGAAAAAADPTDRLRLSSIGWARWAPVQVGAIGVHVLGGVGVIRGNRRRLSTQTEAQVNTAVKIGLTGVAVGLTAWSGLLGRKVAEHQGEGAKGATEPHASASSELESAQTQLRMVQWAIPAVTGVLVALGAQQGEQQRSLHGIVDRAADRVGVGR